MTTGYEQLFNYYNHANTINSAEMRLWFKNTAVKATTTTTVSAAASSTNPDWSNKGKWRGSCNSGWPGGAETIIRPSSIRASGAAPPPYSAVSSASRRVAPTTSNQKRHPPEHRQQLPQNKGAAAQEDPEWYEAVRTDKSPNHRHSSKPIPILRKAGGVTMGRKVSFAQHHEEKRFYYKERPSCSLLMQGSGMRHTSSDGQFAINSSSRHSESNDRKLQKLVQAIRRDSYQDVVELLQGGDIRTDAMIDKKNWLSREYAHAKENGMASSAVVKVLQIYQAAAASINFAVSLKTWHRYLIKVRGITSLRLSGSGLQSGITSFKGAAFSEVNGNKKELESLPPMEISSVVDYGVGNAPLPEYSLYFNPSLLNDTRGLVIELYSEKAGLSSLATLELPLQKISAASEQAGRAIELVAEFRGTDFVADGAKVCVEVQKATVEPGYIGKESGL
jgi:hypothetical protein